MHQVWNILRKKYERSSLSITEIIDYRGSGYLIV